MYNLKKEKKDNLLAKMYSKKVKQKEKQILDTHITGKIMKTNSLLSGVKSALTSDESLIEIWIFLDFCKIMVVVLSEEFKMLWRIL